MALASNTSQGEPSGAPPVRCVGLLLAAGRGRRFDASGQQDKLLQVLRATGAAYSPGGSHPGPASQTPRALSPTPRPDVHVPRVASQACERLSAGTDAVLAVIRPDAPPLLREVLEAARATVVVCPQADQGMGHSLAHALRSARARWTGLDSVLVMPADLPWVLPETVRTVAHALREGDDSIVVPVAESGERGHPVGFAARHFDAMSQLTGDAGARALLAQHPVRRILLHDPGILRDIDTPGDLTPLPS